MALCLAWSAACSFQAQAFSPTRLMATSVSKARRAGSHRGACQKLRAAIVTRLKERARLELTKSNCAKSHAVCSACTWRNAVCCNVTVRLKLCSANAATAGAATSGCSGGQFKSATVAGDNGHTVTAPRPVHTTCGALVSPVTNNVSKCSPGANSGTTRLGANPACSSACKAARNQLRSHAATHSGASGSGWGASAKCSWAGSSSRRSSSRPSSTARRRGVLTSCKKRLLSVPLGNCT